MATATKAQKTNLKRITDQETAWEARNAVMDATRNRLYNTPYAMTNVFGDKMDGVISMTMPYAAIFVNSVVSDLMDSIQALVVEGEVTGRKSAFIEDFLNSLGEQEDEILIQSQGFTLNEWLASHVCVRSFIGQQYTTEIADGKFRMKSLPVDMRWTPFERSLDSKSGLAWVAPLFYRNEDDINHEYEKDIKARGLPWFSGTDITVRDFWDSKVNQVWIDDKIVREQKNKFGYPPFIIGAPATGFMLRDKGYLEHESEDLLFLIRGLYDEINRLASIQQTKAMETIAPGYLDKREQIDNGPARQPPKNNETVQSKVGEGFEFIPRPDLNNAFMTANAEMKKVLSDGSYTSVDLGNVTQQVSSIWITAQSGIRKKFSNQRLKALANFKAQKARMAIDQYILFAKTSDDGFSLGATGTRRLFPAAKLGDPETYKVKYELRSNDPLLEIANLTQFTAAFGKLPLKYNLTNILKASDPDGIIRQLELEQAKADDPAIGHMERALRLIEEAEDMEDAAEANALLVQSKRATQTGVAIIRQSQAPAMPAGTPATAGAPAVAKPPPSANNPLAASVAKMVTAKAGRM